VDVSRSAKPKMQADQSSAKETFSGNNNQKISDQGKSANCRGGNGPAPVKPQSEFSHPNEAADVTLPAKPNMHANQSSGKETFSGDDNQKILAGKKRKTQKVYMRRKSMAESNKKMKRTSDVIDSRSADQAGAVEQPRHTQ
jgi:hypothetical protein